MLYARIILACKEGDRARAIRAVQEEMEAESAEAAAYVDRVWKRYGEQIPPTEFHSMQRGLSARTLAGVAGLVAAAGALLWHFVGK